MNCKYCNINLSKITSGHLRKCQAYLDSSDRPVIPDCLCGYKATSKTAMHSHRVACDIWKARDSRALRLERQTATFQTKYGVTDPMQLDSVKQKVVGTMTERYGAHSLSKQSAVFPKVLRQIQQRSPIRRQKIATEKDQARRQCAQQAKLIKPELIPFEFKQVIIRRSVNDHADFFKQFHYAGYGRSGSAVYEVILGDQFIGAVKFARVVRLEVASTLGLSYDEVLELDRFCIHPSYQKKNFASFIMSRIIPLVRYDFPQVKTLASFADSGQGHVGTIYKASNWKEVGKTADSYTYVDIDGNTVNKKSLYNQALRRGMKEREYAESQKLVKVKIPHKIKFIYEL